MTKVTPDLTPENAALYRDWQRARKGEGHDPLPRHEHALALLQEHVGGRSLIDVTRAEVLDWLGSMTGDAGEGPGHGVSPGSRKTYFSSARAFYNWASSEEEGLLDKSPMHRMREPKAPERPVPIPDADVVRHLIAETERDRTPMGRRDTAILRVMCDTGGPRASEAAGLLICGRPGAPKGLGVDLSRDHVTVKGKGSVTRTWPIASKTATAVSRWIRARDGRRGSDKHARLWLPFGSSPQPMTRAGITDILERRCAAAGVPVLHPHQLRHFAYHHFLLQGGRENDAMVLFGWQDDQMPRHYAKSLAKDRALQAGNALAIGDLW